MNGRHVLDAAILEAAVIDPDSEAGALIGAVHVLSPIARAIP